MKPDSNIISFFNVLINKQESYVIDTYIPTHTKTITTRDKRIFLIDSDKIYEYLWMSKEIVKRAKIKNEQT